MDHGGIMKIKNIEVIFTWEDGTVNDVSCYLPEYTSRALEDFADYWEEKYSDDEEEDEDEC